MSIADRAQKEAEYLKTVLQGLGFNLWKTRNMEDCIDRAMGTLYHVVDCYNIRLDTMTVGNCYLYGRANNIITMASSLNAHVIPKEMINQLVLLGYENDNDNWLEYEREIK